MRHPSSWRHTSFPSSKGETPPLPVHSWFSGQQQGMNRLLHKTPSLASFPSPQSLLFFPLIPIAFPIPSSFFPWCRKIHGRWSYKGALAVSEKDEGGGRLLLLCRGQASMVWSLQELRKPLGYCPLSLLLQKGFDGSVKQFSCKLPFPYGNGSQALPKLLIDGNSYRYPLRCFLCRFLPGLPLLRFFHNKFPSFPWFHWLIDLLSFLLIPVSSNSFSLTGIACLICFLPFDSLGLNQSIHPPL